MNIYNFLSRSISPKDCINELLIGEIGNILPKHPYLGFLLICSGIEFLGKCLDSSAGWDDDIKHGFHFKKAITELFPAHYESLKEKLYKELRCGMTHSLRSGTFKLTELKNDPTGTLQYSKHLKSDKSIIVIDYFYFDFVQACIKVVAMKFLPEDKMNKEFIGVGPLN